ncbi:MAG: hypothetical protein K8Q91_03545 [Candidatus Vogelbacteria bacterium]|nr:hypothetical protein [Candidatus Vogelbacteria bacterium]
MTIRKVLFILIGLMILSGVLLVVWKLGDKTIQQKQQQAAAEQAAILAKEERAKMVALIQTINGEEFEHFDTATWPKFILASQLNIQKSTSTKDVQSYGLAVTNLMRPLVISATLPSELLLEAYEKGTPESTKQLDELAQNFNSATTNLSQLSVPANAEVAHLRLVNSLQRYSFILNNMNQISKNPVWALEASQDHKQVFEELVNDLMFMNAFFSEHKIKISKQNQIQLYIPNTQ